MDNKERKLNDTRKQRSYQIDRILHPTMAFIHSSSGLLLVNCFLDWHLKIQQTTYRKYLEKRFQEIPKAKLNLCCVTATICT